MDFFEGTETACWQQFFIYANFTSSALTNTAGFIVSTDADAEDRHGRRWRNDKDQWVSGIYPTRHIAVSSRRTAEAGAFKLASYDIKR